MTMDEVAKLIFDIVSDNDYACKISNKITAIQQCPIILGNRTASIVYRVQDTENFLPHQQIVSTTRLCAKEEWEKWFSRPYPHYALELDITSDNILIDIDCLMSRNPALKDLIREISGEWGDSVIEKIIGEKEVILRNTKEMPLHIISSIRIN